MAQDPIQSKDLIPIRFADLKGWETDDHAAALSAFLRFCEADTPAGESSPAFLLSGHKKQDLCSAADRADNPREFFETHFAPHQIRQKGFVTGYYEPEVAASRQKTGTYSVPLLKKPAGLEHVPVEDRPDGWPSHLSHGRRVNGTLTEMPDRAAIMDGALDSEELDLVWLRDPVDAYYIHVQGSARLKLTDGSTMRVGYAGKSGHPYTGIARLLVQRGEGTAEDFTMSGLRHWLSDNAAKRDDLFRENRSYIFFREVTEAKPEDGPIGGAGLPLVAGRSLAIDTDRLDYGVPVFVSADFPDPDKAGHTFKRLMITDDTGSAIKGPARGDIFTGSGDEAGKIAGEIRHDAVFTALLPKSGAEMGHVD